MVADCKKGITVLQTMTKAGAELLPITPQAKLTQANAHGQQPTGGSTRRGSTSGKEEEVSRRAQQVTEAERQPQSGPFVRPDILCFGRIGLQVTGGG